MDLEVKQIDIKANYMRVGKLFKGMKETIKKNKSKPPEKNEDLLNKLKKHQNQLLIPWSTQNRGLLLCSVNM